MILLTAGALFCLVTLALFAVAIVVHISSVNLGLPIAPGLTLITLLLPLAATINAFYHPHLLHAARGAHSLLRRLTPPALQTAQAVVTAVLVVLLLQHAVPGTVALDCGLATQWQRMFAAKDAATIRRIQDALDCCGFNSVRDRAWPFPSGHGGGGDAQLQCARRFDRDVACAGPWRDVERRNAGIDLGVVLAVALLQIASLLLAREAADWRRAWWAQGWQRATRFRSGRHDDDEDGQQGRFRPLLEAPEASDDEADEPVSYSDLSSPPSRSQSQSQSQPGTGPQGQAHKPQPRQHYGTTQARDSNENVNGPRVEPSMLEGNAWNRD